MQLILDYLLQREKPINYIEILSGTRFHATLSLINKLRYDISLFFIDPFIYRLLYYIRKLKEIHNILSINQCLKAFSGLSKGSSTI